MINSWKNQAATEYIRECYLTGGDHVLRVEYYERTGQASVRLELQPINFHYELFDNIALSGGPDATFNDTATDLEWRHAPPVASLIQGQFSLRGTAELYFREGGYCFHAIHTGGCRIYIDDNLVLDDWSGTVTSGSAYYVSEGIHEIRVEFKQEDPVPAPGVQGYYRAALNFGWSEEQWTADFYHDRVRESLFNPSNPEPDHSYMIWRTLSLTGNPLYQTKYAAMRSNNAKICQLLVEYSDGELLFVRNIRYRRTPLFYATFGMKNRLNKRKDKKHPFVLGITTSSFKKADDAVKRSVQQLCELKSEQEQELRILQQQKNLRRCKQRLTSIKALQQCVDYTILYNDEAISCHRAIIFERCFYLKQLAEQRNQLEPKSCLRLTSKDGVLSIDVLSIVLDYLYSDRWISVVQATHSLKDEVLKCASEWKLNRLVTICKTGQHPESDRIYTSFASLCNNKQWSDVILSFEVEENEENKETSKQIQIYAHRPLLIASSPFFCALLSRCHDDIVHIGSDIDEKALHIFLKCCYEFRIHRDEAELYIDQGNGQSIINAFELSYRFILPPLQQFIETFLSELLDSENCLEIFQMADSFQSRQLRENSFDFIADRYTALGSRIHELSAKQREQFELFLDNNEKGKEREATYQPYIIR